MRLDGEGSASRFLLFPFCVLALGWPSASSAKLMLPAASVTGELTAPPAGPVLYADVAFHQDHVFFAVEQQGTITLLAYDHATTTPSLLRTVAFGNDSRVPSLSDVRDGRIAVLATDSRVVVAWTTQEVLGPNDAAGGYAVFACTTP